jgi:[ribosomal protein S5]-alanine N-acetyltransferase
VTRSGRPARACAVDTRLTLACGDTPTGGGATIAVVPNSTLLTDRLELCSMTLAIVEAVMTGERVAAERLIGAPLPAAWPGRALIERAFCASLEAIRADPERRLWGDRVMIARHGPRRVLGSVVFHGAPDKDGAVEVAYGVEHESQQQGYATEATRAAVAWALEHPGVVVVRATTPSWHMPSRRVLEKCGFALVGTRDSEAMLGELHEFERRS